MDTQRILLGCFKELSLLGDVSNNLRRNDAKFLINFYKTPVFLHSLISKVLTDFVLI